MIEACTGPTIGMSGAMAAEGGGGGVVGFVQRHLPLRGEASWGGDPPTPPLSLRGPSGGCCARHHAGLWRAAPRRREPQSGRAREERMTRVGQGAGRLRKGGGGGVI